MDSSLVPVFSGADDHSVADVADGGDDVAATAKGKQAEPGASLVRELLETRDPAELTAWFVEQVGQLKDNDVDVQSLPIYSIASSLNDLSLEEKNEFVGAVVKGFGEMPPEKRAEVLPLAMDLVDTFEQAKKTQPAETGVSDAPAFAKNLAELIAAGGGGVAEDEIPVLKQTVQGEVAATLQENPAALLDMLTELPEEDRERLTAKLDQLQEANVVSKEQRQVIGEVIKPGGYADKLSGTLKLVGKAYTYRRLLPALAVIELVCSFGLKHADGSGASQLSWLFWDAVLALAVAGTLYKTVTIVFPVLDKLKKNPGATTTALQQALETGWDDDVTNALGINESQYQSARVYGGVFFVLFTLQVPWILMGLFDVVAGFRASVLVLLVCVCFVALRASVFVCLYCAANHIYGEVQLLRGGNDVPSYGTVDP